MITLLSMFFLVAILGPTTTFDDTPIMSSYKCQQVHVAQLSQRDRAVGCVSFGQKWKNGTRIRYFADIIGPSSTTVT